MDVLLREQNQDHKSKTSHVHSHEKSVCVFFSARTVTCVCVTCILHNCHYMLPFPDSPHLNVSLKTPPINEDAVFS